MYKQRDEYTAAREIIDLYYDTPDSADIIESLSCICFSLARIFEQGDKRTIWDDMFDYFDQDYTAIKKKLERPNRQIIDDLYREIINHIHYHTPTLALDIKQKTALSLNYEES